MASPVSKLIKESHLDFLSELHDQGVTLPDESYDQLVSAKRIKLNPNEPDKKEKSYSERAILSDGKTETQRAADALIDIIDSFDDIPGYDETKRHIV